MSCSWVLASLMGGRSGVLGGRANVVRGPSGLVNLIVVGVVVVVVVTELTTLRALAELTTLWALTESTLEPTIGRTSETGAISRRRGSEVRLRGKRFNETTVVRSTPLRHCGGSGGSKSSSREESGSLGNHYELE